MRKSFENRWRALSGNVRGSIWVLLASFLAAVMGALIKFVGQRIPVFEILFIRQLCVVAILLPVIARNHSTVFRTNQMKLHVMRGTFAAVAMASGFTALVHMPLAEATAISFAKTLFATLLAIVFLKETVGVRRWTVTIIGFIGVLIIIRPGADAINAYAWLALTSSLFVAGVMVVLRKLSQTDPAATIMSYQSCFITVIMAGPAIYFWITPTWTEIAIIMVIGGLMSMMQWVYIQGMKAAEAVAVAPVEYARLLFATIIGVLVFAEIPSIWTLAGSTIIIGSTFYTIHRNAIRKKQSYPET